MQGHRVGQAGEILELFVVRLSTTKEVFNERWRCGGNSSCT